MKVEIRPGDEKPNQYILLAWENDKEWEFLSELRDWWSEQDR